MNAYEFIVKMRDMAGSELRNIAKQVGITNNNVGDLNRGLGQTETASSKLVGSMGRLKNVLVSVFAVGAVWAFTQKVIDARSEYEKFDAVLTNTFGSAEVGKSALNMLTDFAAKTPYQLDDLTGSFVKLVNRGFNPTKDELRNIGDLAASQGKGFDQLTEGILDAQTGEFERMKEFGIQASKHGNMVSFSFKGVTKTVENNQQAIAKTILEYGKMPGVAGAMNAISGTLGGKISNLKDSWNMLLVSVGGKSGEVFSGAINMLSQGLATVSTYIPSIYAFFENLGSVLSPLVSSIKMFLQSAFGFSSAGDIIGAFGNVISKVMVWVNLLAIGLTTIIDWLRPFSGVIMGAVGAWTLLNLAFAMSPLGWIVLGIMAIITVIGMVVKYTSGWGESWKHTVNGAKFLWQAYTEYVKANFNTVVQAIMVGIDYIKIGWYKFKEAVGIGDSSENQKMLAGLNSSVEARKKSITDGYKKMADSALQAKNEFSQVGIKVDTNGISKDFKALQKKFSSTGGATNKAGSTEAYDNWRAKNALNQPDKGGAGANVSKGDSITGGGSKMTTVNITIGKLQDGTNIYVTNTKDGLSDLGDKVQEILLRAVNSVNQVQTG